MTTNNAWNSENPAQVARGGTGLSSTTAYAVLCGGTTSTSDLQSISSVGTSGEILTSNGAALPSFEAAASAGAWVFISSATADDDATVEFNNLSSTYFMYMIVFENVAPASNGVQLRLRTSTDNGVSFSSTSGDYRWGGEFYIEAEGGASLTGTNASNIRINGNPAQQNGNGSNENLSGHTMIYNPSSTNFTRCNTIGTFFGADPNMEVFYTGGQRNSAADVDAIQYTFNSGNVSTGIFNLYGLLA